jgi:hypothetical protein
MGRSCCGGNAAGVDRAGWHLMTGLLYPHAGGGLRADEVFGVGQGRFAEYAQADKPV